MEIKDKIGSSYENVVAAVQIANTLSDVKTDKMRQVFEGVKLHMSQLGYNDPLDSYESDVESYYRIKKSVWSELSYEIPVAENSVKGKIKLRFEIEERLYFGLCPMSKGDKTKEVAQYIDSHLRPKTIDSQVSDCWYWWAYLHDGNAVNYLSGNDEYLKLFDETGFQEYMDRICKTIDSVIPVIMGKE